MNESDFKERISRMYVGDREAIVEGLNHPGCLDRTHAIIALYKNNIRDPDMIQQLFYLKSDTTPVLHARVGDFADAVLHLYGIEKYNGDRDFVWSLINSNLQEFIDDSISG